MKKILLGRVTLLAGIIISCNMILSGCGKESTIDADMTKVSTNIDAFNIKENVKVVGLGEASHGNSEYQQSKKEVFKYLVENNECKTFIIEGDFGGSLKVDDYINGNNNDIKSSDVIREVGFGIYRTDEMVDLIDWMKEYNETVSDDMRLHFYGMDMQRIDNSKEYLFNVLAKTNLFDENMTVVSEITNDNRFDKTKDDYNLVKDNLSELLVKMDANKDIIVSANDEESFEFARECAQAMEDYMEILAASDADYNKLRDKSMYRRVKWFMEKGDGSVIFITGHNGHIGKTSVAAYTCLGALLDSDMKDEYYAIGTDAGHSQLSSQNDDGSFRVVEVDNYNNLSNQAKNVEGGKYYIDFHSESINSDTNWQQIINGKLSVTTINVSLSDWQTKSKALYTSKIVPADTFDGMIIYDSVTPTHTFE